MFVFVKIWGSHGNRLRAGLAVCMPLTEALTSTSLTGRCGRIVTLSDENRRTSGVRSPDEHSNKSLTTSCRSGSSCAGWVSSGGTGFPTMPAHSTTRAAASRHLRLPAPVTARHGQTTFHATRLSPILALCCAFKTLKNKNTVWSISGAGSTNFALNSSPDAVICSTHPRFQLV